METKLCINCEHYKGDAWMRCGRPTGNKSLITGGDIMFDIPASGERSHGWINSRLDNKCGKEGRFFKAK